MLGDTGNVFLLPVPEARGSTDSIVSLLQFFARGTNLHP